MYQVLDFSENQMHRANFWLTPKNQKDQKGSTLFNNELSSLLDTISVSSSSSSSSSSDEYNDVKNEANTNQLAPDPLLLQPLPCRLRKPPSSTPRVLPEVIAFTVQCASCYKWRLIPTKEKYEEIREYILQNPFVCEKAREWRPYLSCDVLEDVSPDNNLIWAIDKADIPQTPDGWQRLLRIRGEGSTKFADMYVSIIGYSFDFTNICSNTTIMNFGYEFLICLSSFCHSSDFFIFQILYSTIRQENALNGRGQEVCSFCFTTQCDVESYLVLIELLLVLLLKFGFHLSYISLTILVF